ncbi:alanine racemase [Litorivivens sp.]|uniref:alanine racemase n=1 Tax=Litorivivens sp. TaxID=2020868 RepID=UPI003568B4E0
MEHTAWAEIKLSALSHNLAQVRQCAPKAKVISMIKADAYGHGLVEVGKQLAPEADMLGVARLSEAQTLRNQGISAPILLMGTLLSDEALRYCATHRIALAIHTLAQARQVAALGIPMELWLKLDTGMNRLGLSEVELHQAHQVLSTAKAAHSLNLMTHFSSADEDSAPITTEQIDRFDRVANHYPNLSRSLANSAAIISAERSHREWVRPGIMLYGSNPTAIPMDLMPVMTLKSRILAVKSVSAGESVGYNGKWTASRDSRIAAIGIGYGDGYPRQLPNSTPVLVNGHRFPVVGRISMDICSIDITDSTLQINEGDNVTLWGEGLPADDIAPLANTISYHLFTGVTSRVPRLYR